MPEWVCLTDAFVVVLCNTDIVCCVRCILEQQTSSGEEKTSKNQPITGPTENSADWRHQEWRMHLKI